MRTPDFNNILKIFNKQKPDRFTLFEYYLNDDINDYFTQGTPYHASDDPVEQGRYIIEAFKNVGYDYAQMIAGRFQFNYGKFETQKTRPLNDGVMRFLGYENLCYTFCSFEMMNSLTSFYNTYRGYAKVTHVIGRSASGICCNSMIKIRHGRSKCDPGHGEEIKREPDAYDS